jgi:hypothetical protein
VLDRASGRKTRPISNEAELARISPDGTKVGDLENFVSVNSLAVCVFSSSGAAQLRGVDRHLRVRCWDPERPLGAEGVLAVVADHNDCVSRQAQAPAHVPDLARRGFGRCSYGCSGSDYWDEQHR